MKTLKTLAIVMVMALVGASTASAQFKWGPKVGFQTSKLHFDDFAKNFDTNSMTGFTGGLMAEFTVPVINVAFDASVMYAHRGSIKYIDSAAAEQTIDRDYIEVPINFKYKIGLPIAGNIVAPYIFTGPSFAFRCSKEGVENVIENKACDISWNVGLGVQLINHIQISGSYGFGLSESVTQYIPNLNQVNNTNGEAKGKDRFWTITAAYLF